MIVRCIDMGMGAFPVDEYRYDIWANGSYDVYTVRLGV